MKYSIDNFEVDNIKNYEIVIVGSCVYGGKMPALEFIQANWEALKEKNVFYFTVGIIPPDAQFSLEMYETIPTFIRNSVKYVKLPGTITNMNPNFLQKLAFKLFTKGDLESKTDKSKLMPIIDFVKSCE